MILMTEHSFCTIIFYPMSDAFFVAKKKKKFYFYTDILKSTCHDNFIYFSTLDVFTPFYIWDRYLGICYSCFSRGF